MKSAPYAAEGCLTQVAPVSVVFQTPPFSAPDVEYPQTKAVVLEIADIPVMLSVASFAPKLITGSNVQVRPH